MIKGWVIYDQIQLERNQWFADHLMECGRELAQMKMILVEQLWFGHENGQITFRYQGQELAPPDFAISRTILPLLSLCLEQVGTRVYNSYQVSKICNDKRLTYAVLSGCGVPIMKTRFCEAHTFDLSCPWDEEYPVVIKSAAGHGGKEVFLANDRTELLCAIGTLNGKSFVLQELCRPYGKDLRVYVLGGKILASVLRSSDSFKSNYSLGGSISRYSLNENEEETVRKVIRGFPASLDFVGIDFLVSEKGLVFNEIEDVVGTRMLYACTEIDAVKALMSYIQDLEEGLQPVQ